MGRKNFGRRVCRRTPGSVTDAETGTKGMREGGLPECVAEGHVLLDEGQGYGQRLEDGGRDCVEVTILFSALLQTEAVEDDFRRVATSASSWRRLFCENDQNTEKEGACRGRM